MNPEQGPSFEWWQTSKQTSTAAANYDVAHAADYRSTKIEYEAASVLSKAAKLLPSITSETPIFDNYAGNGPHARWLTQQGYKIYMGEYATGMIQNAQTKAREHALQIPITQLDARFLPFQSDYFAIYQAHNTSMLGFFANPEDNLQVLSEAQRVIRPGGVLAFDLANLPYLQQLGDYQSKPTLVDHTLVTTARQLIETEQGTFTDFTESFADSSDPFSEIARQHIRIQVFEIEQVTAMLRQTGFDRIYTYPNHFTYDTTGAMGTRGVRNLYLAQKPK
jgi:ubiquinone/menaquinone biosynthesis C-methylase UbiE